MQDAEGMSATVRVAAVLEGGCRTEDTEPSRAVVGGVCRSARYRAVETLAGCLSHPALPPPQTPTPTLLAQTGSLPHRRCLLRRLAHWKAGIVGLSLEERRQSVNADGQHFCGLHLAI